MWNAKSKDAKMKYFAFMLRFMRLQIINASSGMNIINRLWRVALCTPIKESKSLSSPKGSRNKAGLKSSSFKHEAGKKSVRAR
jgi:hypothetical protein